VEHLKSRKTLLILDNFEHLIEACAELADALLRACPDLKFLATSREPLRVPGETNFVVPSLSLPEPGRSPSTGELTGYEAVRLFVERAGEADSGLGPLSIPRTSAIAPSTAPEGRRAPAGPIPRPPPHVRDASPQQERQPEDRLRDARTRLREHHSGRLLASHA
jgi:hypothetical protein